MGQYYIIVNVSKSQVLAEDKAWGLYKDGLVRLSFVLRILDLGDYSLSTKDLSLQNLCLKYLIENEQHFPLSLIQALLPKHLLKKMDIFKDVLYLSQLEIGTWAGDRIVIAGQDNDYSPFPPDGEWKEGSLFDMVSEKPECFHQSKLYDQGGRLSTSLYFANLAKIKDILANLFDGKVHLMVNLDKKEYLDPREYQSKEKNILDFMKDDDWINIDLYDHDALAGLIITLLQSTLWLYVNGAGIWAGDRIIMTTPEQLDDFQCYKDISQQCIDTMEINKKVEEFILSQISNS